MENLVFVFWYWWILAIGFLAVEMVLSGFFFLWLSVSALITGLIVWLIPAMALDIQIFCFALLAILTLVMWRVFPRKPVAISDQPLLNKRGQQYVGRTFTLYEAIENGQGKIKVDDSIWKVQGEDCNIDAKVKVVAIHGTVFEVVKIA